jgi:uncharacterized phage protein gp47/JayE
MPLTNSGYDAKRAAEWREEIRNAYENATGLSPDWSRDTFLAQITAIMADRLGELSQEVLNAYDTFNPQRARGVYLDVIGSIYGISRLRPTYSVVDVTLKGDAGTVVPIETEIQDKNNNIWIQESEADLGSNGEATVQFRAEERGRIVIDSKDIDTANDQGSIVTAVSGLGEAVNNSSGDTGRDEETDNEFRERVISSQDRLGKASLDSIRSSIIQDVSQVTSAEIIDNSEDYTVQSPNGLDVASKSFVLYIYPKSVSDQAEYEKSIAETIFKNAPSGIKSGLENSSDQDVSVFYKVNDGYTKEFSWQWVDDKTITVDIDIDTIPSASVSDVDQEIKDEIIAYFDQVLPGEDTNKLPILGRLSAIDEIEDVVSIKFNGQNEVQIPITEIAVTDSSNINVT